SAAASSRTSRAAWKSSAEMRSTPRLTLSLDAGAAAAESSSSNATSSAGEFASGAAGPHAPWAAPATTNNQPIRILFISSSSHHRNWAQFTRGYRVWGSLVMDPRIRLRLFRVQTVQYRPHVGA